MESSKPSESKVSVFCRFRPLSTKEKGLGEQIVYKQLSDKAISVMTTKPQECLEFNYDAVFSGTAKQSEVFELSCQPILSKILEGYNGTVMAYGQTSSGKTHTMQGPQNPSIQELGIIPRAASFLFNVAKASQSHLKFQIKLSVVELYMEQIRDLLENSKKQPQIRQAHGSVFLEGVSEYVVKTQQEFAQLMVKVNSIRATSATNHNVRSSRSHLIVILNIRQENLKDLKCRMSKLYLVDLAGSEKISKTAINKHMASPRFISKATLTLQEAKKINSSLTALGKVINALAQAQSHVPFRQSKLTRLLQDSLGGNSLTAMIITCSPHVSNLAETLSTLRFGDNTKLLRNRIKMSKRTNSYESDVQFHRLKRQNEQNLFRIKMLENMLENKQLGDLDMEALKSYKELMKKVKPGEVGCLQTNQMTCVDPLSSQDRYEQYEASEMGMSEQMRQSKQSDLKSETPSIKSKSSSMLLQSDSPSQMELLRKKNRELAEENVQLKSSLKKMSPICMTKQQQSNKRVRHQRSYTQMMNRHENAEEPVSQANQQQSRYFKSKPNTKQRPPQSDGKLSIDDVLNQFDGGTHKLLKRNIQQSTSIKRNTPSSSQSHKIQAFKLQQLKVDSTSEYSKLELSLSSDGQGKEEAIKRKLQFESKQEESDVSKLSFREQSALFKKRLESHHETAKNLVRVMESSREKRKKILQKYSQKRLLTFEESATKQ